MRCKTPELVRKELWTHVLAYNLIRTIMAQAATKHGIDPRSISFKKCEGARNPFHWTAFLLNRVQLLILQIPQKRGVFVIYKKQ